MIKRKNIDAAREARLWIGQIVVPVATAIVGVVSVPEFREAFKAKCVEAKLNAEDKIKSLKRK